MTSCSRIQATSRQNKAVGKKPCFREHAKSETARKMENAREGPEIAFVVVFCIYQVYREGPPWLAFAFTQELSICMYVRRQGSKSRSKKWIRQKHSGAIRFALNSLFSYRRISSFVDGFFLVDHKRISL